MVSRVVAKYGIEGKSDPVNPGVWIGDSKIAAIGIKVSRWITMHGVGLNVKKEALDGFARIIPCGIHDKQVTAIEYMNETPRNVNLEEVASEIIDAFSQEFNAHLISEPSELTARYLNEPYVDIETYKFQRISLTL